MTSSTVIISVILILFSLTILGTLGYFIFKPTRELILRSRSKSELAKKLDMIQRFDTLLENGAPLDAIPHLSSILFLDIPRSAENLSGIREINQAFLARALALSEKLGAHIPNIEVVETLIVERGELTQLLFKAKYSYETILEKRENDGKSLPRWSLNEFERKEGEIESSLSINLKNLKSEINKLELSLKQGSIGEYLIH